MLIDLNKIHPSWRDFFTEAILEELNLIEKNIGDSYFPCKENILRFTKLDLYNVKCIIVGMEPYPSSYEKDGIIYPEATGRSFEVSSISSWSEKFKQSSLRNILKTIYLNEYNNKVNLETVRNSIQNNTFPIKDPNEWFDSLEKQGVMFLNATLTVLPNNVDTHTKIWSDFMNYLIEYITNKTQNVKWLLWGNKAQERILPLIKQENAICSHHPRLASFVDENCFSKVKEINWMG